MSHPLFQEDGVSSSKKFNRQIIKVKGHNRILRRMNETGICYGGTVRESKYIICLLSTFEMN